MADTVKLPAIGPVKKQYVYIGGALIVGIVGYAWWTRSAGEGEPAPAPLEPTADDYGAYAEDRIPPPTTVGASSYDQYGVGAVINTNTEWFTAATSSLVDAGYEPLTVINTLGKFLQRKPLSANEQVLVQAAKGFVGEPPQGGPWPIISELPPPATTPPPSGGTTPLGTPRVNAVRVPGGRWAVTWSGVTGATGYQIRAVTGHTGDAVRDLPATARAYTATAQAAGGHLAFEVRAKKDNAVGPWGRKTVVGR